MTRRFEPGGSMPSHFKDEILDQLARSGNVAQFVSFGPGADLMSRYSRIAGEPPNEPFGGAGAAIATLLHRAPEQRVNVRSFKPDQPRSHEFLYGLEKTEEVLAHVRGFSERGLYSIVNETIDVDDGGVSGVVFGGTVEFAPGHTPRLVDQPDVDQAELPLGLAVEILEMVYGFRPAIEVSDDLRTEFSVHPLRRGYLRDHTVLWEQERIVDDEQLKPRIRWPNEFSRFMGDKAYGLLLAHCLGLLVPRTTVISRRLPPFSFGGVTGTGEIWLRTCPRTQVPGFFPTHRGWRDPFTLLEERDERKVVSSVLAQEGVEAGFSGALLTTQEGTPRVEGVQGGGQEFMQSERAPEELPNHVVLSVLEVFRRASAALGPVRFEWVHDGNRAWVVQLHTGASTSSGRTVVSGTASRWHAFDVKQGLEALRALSEAVRGTGEGVVLNGNVGITSHMADLLRRAAIPSRIEPGENETHA